MVLQMMVHQPEMCNAQVKVQIQKQAHTQQQGQGQQAAQAQAQEAQAQEAQAQEAQAQEAQAQQEVQVEEREQQAAQPEAQEKQLSVQYQLGSHQQQLQQDLQGLAPSASHTWPNLAPIQVEPSSLAPPHQPREELPQPEAELKPSLRAPADWSGQQTQVQPQQHPQSQICSPSSSMVSPARGCPYPPCQLYCLEGHSRSEQRLTSTETSSAVAEGAAPYGSWRCRFHSP